MAFFTSPHDDKKCSFNHVADSDEASFLPVTFAADEAKRLNLGVDVANGTGWPFGGPWVSDEDASKTIYSKTYSLNGGETLSEPIEYKQEAFVRTANNKPAGVDSILQPLSANKNLQALALDQIF